MPVAIIIAEGVAPAVLEADSDAALLDRVAELRVTPPDAKESVAACRAWLEGLPAPSGWFATTEEAEAFRERTARERDAQLMRAALKHTGLSHREMTAALGLADAAGDGSPVRKITLAKVGLSGPTRRSLAYLIRHGAMTREQEAAALNRIANGEWRTVQREAIRRA
ncbi:hypothetical protein IMF23_04385 [Chelatococcus daeguensis]|uniref:hypothetical protein n=1 Tax=Chelatococcus daeguensis TaxID=444444 RepID=UPI0007AC09D6|nr:hypothetical protein [Chelatococcus daeguensis]KZE34116.1 hypothetical protein AVW15_17530 [Chelatococcus daeguensis]MBM3082674.1 hypothetical protein [Chelatococcus daeguensis]